MISNLFPPFIPFQWLSVRLSCWDNWRGDVLMCLIEEEMYWCVQGSNQVVEIIEEEMYWCVQGSNQLTLIELFKMILKWNSHYTKEKIILFRTHGYFILMTFGIKQSYCGIWKWVNPQWVSTVLYFK